MKSKTHQGVPAADRTEANGLNHTSPGRSPGFKTTKENRSL